MTSSLTTSRTPYRDRWMAEAAKSFEERHPVAQWREMVKRSVIEGKKCFAEDGTPRVSATGLMWAYLLLGYDLYTLESHGLLEGRHLHRLQIADQYQGVRHELFAAATCLRAGFAIKYNDESGKSGKQTEFIATHRRTGMQLCVEAKSKKRDGVLGARAGRASTLNHSRGLVKKINEAVGKPHAHPLVIFLDLDLPPFSASPGTQDWLDQIADPVLSRARRTTDSDAWELVVFSNQPNYYLSGETAAFGYAVGMFGERYKEAASLPQERTAIFDAADNYGSLPRRFEDL